MMSNSNEKLSEDRYYLVLDNQNLVHHILQHQLHKYPNDPYYEDLVQEGMYALCLSAIRFNIDSNAKFTTYSGLYIKGYMQRYIHESIPPIKYPRTVNDYKYQIYNLRKSNPNLTDEELIEILNIPTDLINAIFVGYVKSLDEFLSFNSDDSDKLTIADTVGQIDPELDGLISNDLIEKGVNYCIKNYSKKQADICEDYIYTMIYDDPWVLVDLGNKYGLTQSYVSRILIRFRNDLKNYLMRYG